MTPEQRKQSQTSDCSLDVQLDNLTTKPPTTWLITLIAVVSASDFPNTA
jgi:hypothetical protein